MLRNILIGGMLVTLTLFGCQQSEQTQQPTQTPPAQTPAATQVPQQSPPVETATEGAKPVAGVEENNEGMIEAAAKTVDDNVEKAVETTTESVTAVKETTQDIAATVKKQTTDVVQTGITAADTVVAEVTSTDQPEEVIFEASFGTVTMPHQLHADAFSCAQCHGEGTPGALELGREAAHTLCIGCHQEQKAGPTACTACHKR